MVCVKKSEQLAALARQFRQQVAETRLHRYEPYEWQREYHEAGRTHSEIMLMAANRVGKTMSAGAEMSFHLLGDYPQAGQYRYADTKVNRILNRVGEDVWPEGWKGRVFEKPILGWTGSPTNETSRDIVQTELLGGTGELLGTGWIPKARIVPGSVKTRQAGVKDVVEAFNVRHRAGGISRCLMKTYEQGWKKWQGTAPHVVWMDEEPDQYKIFSEAQTRILSSNGLILVTFTPLSGATEMVEHFRTGNSEDGIWWRGATWGDAPHLDEKEKEKLRRRYRKHERKARTEGIPMMGEGAIFPVDDDDIAVPLFRVPEHWARLKGCDFGIDHPAAGVEIAWDRDQDIIFLIDCYRKEGELPPYHAAWLKKGHSKVPVAWPHDGMNREKAGGRTLAHAYRDHGANMLPKSARYPKVPGENEKGGSQPVWPIIDEIRERMVTGRFKAFEHLNVFFEEKNSYHVKDGNPVARRDDILKALFYAVMMKRYARSLNELNVRRRVTTGQPSASMRI